MQKLYETYERCNGKQLPGSEPLMPIGHTTQQAHIEIVIDGEGNFRRASVVPKGQQTTLIPCTEESGGRSGIRPANHPLCDKLQYVAGDFLDFGGNVTAGFAKEPKIPHLKFIEILDRWSNFDSGHPKIQSVLAYIKQGHVIKDLVNAKVLFDELGPDGARMLVKEWVGKKEDTPEIFRSLPNGQFQEDAFIRWRVERPESLDTGTWEDKDLLLSWVDYYSSLLTSNGMCMVTGDTAMLADPHPKKIRNAGDQAKLISSNDTTGFTFKGRFIDAAQAAGVSFDVTQKAHNALRWLINRGQAFKSGDQVIVSWAVEGQPIPDPWGNSAVLFGDDEVSDSTVFSPGESDPGDIGQAFALRLKRAIAGYRANLEDTTDIVVMGLDSATPGRMAITFYRELKGSEFLERIESWHERNAWPQDFGKSSKFVGVPSPRDIAEAAYGRRIDDKLRKATVERLLPCIIDGMHLPRDLVDSCVRRSINRVGLEHWEWEKCLGTACALYKGFHGERGYQMALEESRKTRDYLYGRLLAVAEQIEETALRIANESRDTSAAKLMHRFADRPSSTWRTIEGALGPYHSRVRAKWPGYHSKLKELMDEIVASFEFGDFVKDSRLEGEFLLGYHCQRQKLREKNESATASSVSND